MPEDCFVFTYYKTNQGYGGLVFSRRGLRRLFLPQAKKAQVREMILREFPGSVYQKDHLKSDEVLAQYFRGEPVKFRFPLDLSGCSDFQRRVYSAARKIPHGKTRSYKWLARSLGQPSASRALGQALKRNPIPVVIPCHRVIRSDHSLGGFSSGTEWKKRLLNLEGAKMKGNKGRYRN